MVRVVGEEVLRRAFLDDDALAHHHDAVRGFAR
jgi:hypothetical protein